MKKFLCLLLTGLMLLSLVSCGEILNNPAGTNGNNGNNQEIDTSDELYQCDLPDDLNYGDETVNILFAKVTGRDDELVDDGTGGVVSEAVHERNVMVEEMLGVVLEMHPEEAGDQVDDVMTRDIQSGLGDYDIVANGTYMAVQPAMEGKYLNLNNLENINTKKHYWTQGYNDMVTFTDSNMQFLASGPIAISMFRYMFLTIYNKTLFTDYKITDLYETVKAGEWTLDYQYSIVKDHYVDKDNDSKASEGDFYGFVTGDTISVDPYMVASDIHMIIKDTETGDLTYNTSAISPLSDLCEKLHLLYKDEATYVYKGATNDDVPYNYIIQHFTDGNAMMATTMFLKMETNFDDLAALSYGIAPMPKFSATQESYYSYVQDQVSCFGISAVVGNEDRQEMCAATLEALAYHSYNLVRPAYYEIALSQRYMQDPQSKEVLDMIFNTLYFDFSSSCSNVITSCVVRDQLRPILSGSNTKPVASSTRSWEKAVSNSLKQYNKKLEEIQ